MRTLFVAGASSDVGSALISRIAGGYDTIWAHYFHWNEKLDALRAELGEKIRFLQADLSKDEDIEKILKEVRESGMDPDHFVYLPMVKNYTTKFKKTALKDFEDGYLLSVRPVVTLLQAFLPAMVKKAYGKVVCMLTAYTVGVPPKYQTAYVTAKYAQLGLLKSLASEYGDKGITFNGVSPDMIQTKFIADLPHLLVEQYAESRPNGRLLTVDDVAPTFEFLLSSGADQINGENILIK